MIGRIALRVSLCLAAFVGLESVSRGAPIAVDNFTAVQDLHSTFMPSGTAGPSSSIQGEYRFAAVTNSPGTPASTTWGAGSGSGIFTISAMTTSAMLSLQYDANGAGLNQSFADVASINLNFQSINATNGPLGVVVTLTDSANQTATTSSVQLSSIASPSTVSFLLDSSTFANIGNLNLSSIKSLKFDFTGSASSGASAGFVLGTTTTAGIQLAPALAPGDPTPEPASVATLVFLGLLGGYVAQRKRKARAATHA
jgi:hypothetical protein